MKNDLTNSYKPNATAASLLGFLHEGPMSGWDLSAHSQKVIGEFWSLTTSQVYRELSNLEKAGFVEREETGPRDRRPYRITTAGKVAFTEWITREPGEEITRFPLLLTVAFGNHLPKEKLMEFTDVHRRIHKRRLDEYLQNCTTLESQAEPHSRFARATLEFGIRYEKTVLEWLDELREILESGEET